MKNHRLRIKLILFVILINFDLNATNTISENVQLSQLVNDCIPEKIGANGAALSKTTCGASYQNDPGICSSINQEATVWFEYTADVNSKAVVIDFSNISMTGLISVETFSGLPDQDCSGTFIPIQSAPSYCGAALSQSFRVSCIDNGINHIYIKIGSSLSGCGLFSLQFREVLQCKSTETCFDIEADILPQTDGPAQCINACNLDNCNEAQDCEDKGASTWFRVRPELSASSMIIQVTEASFSPIISVFSGNNCNSIGQLIECRQTSQLSLPINAINYVYIKVEAQGGIQLGHFNLCVATYFGAIYCYESSSIIMRPEHPELTETDPFCAGETISICHKIVFYVDEEPPPSGNDCQWIQGIIPVLGASWDLDDNSISKQGPLGWKWHGDSSVNYNFTNHNYHLFKKENGDLGLKFDLKNANLIQDDPLPAGWWFTSNGGQGCTNDGDVDNMWGMPGPGCKNIQNIQFCFDLKVKNANELNDCNNSDLSFAIFVFGDGETGCWAKNTCRSIPYIFNGSLICDEVITVNSVDSSICSGSNILIRADAANPNVHLKLIGKENPNIEGETIIGNWNGSASFEDTLTNLGSNTETLIYKFLVQNNEESCGSIHEVKVKVYPELKINVDDVISSSDTCIIIEPLVSGGAGAYQFLWSNGAITEKIEACSSTDTTFTVTVIDSLGCNISKMIKVNYITPNIEVEAGKPAFIISPNPFDQQFVISTNENTTYNFVLYNTFGQAAMEEKNISVKEKTIKTLHLVRGNYFLQIIKDDGSEMHKITKF